MPKFSIVTQAVLKRLLVAVILTTILSAAGIVAVNNMIDSRFSNLKRQEVNVANDTRATEPANFLLIGSDSRSILKSEADKNSFGHEDIGQRSDTIMIIHVDPREQKTVVLAIPRDAYVDIPGIGKNKINASFNKDLGGGPDKVIETIKYNFNIPIQHYVELDFDSFRQIVNALGTVNVYFPAPARDSNNGHNESGLDTKMKSGCIALNGDQALGYVRSRYFQQYIDGKWQADPTSNYGRIARQQAFMKRVASRAIQKSLNDPIKGRKVADAIISNLQVDQNLSKDDIFKLMNAFNGIDPNDPTHVQFEMLPVKSTMKNGMSVDIIQMDQAEPLLEIFRNLDSAPQENAPVALPKPETVKVQVLNGSGRKGLAATAISELQAVGFVPAGTGNTSSRTATEIRYNSSNKAKAMLVSKYVHGTLIADSTIVDADVVVILGDNFTQVDTTGKVQETTSTIAPTTTGQSPSTSVPQSTRPAINGVSDAIDCPA